MFERVTYHWERHCAVCDEVVVKAWQVCAAAVGELNRRLHVDTQAIAALNHIQHLLFGLFQQLLLNRQVLDDGGRVVDAGRSCDIVKRGIVRQRARGRRRQEPGGSRDKPHLGQPPGRCRTAEINAENNVMQLTASRWRSARSKVGYNDSLENQVRNNCSVACTSAAEAVGRRLENRQRELPRYILRALTKQIQSHVGVSQPRCITSRPLYVLQ
ncbi:hypothetical protein IG631_14575 [Alternaria alternata]|nr:hypothetical protein IG631_14575 [Alternaria alternata]